MSEKLTPCVTDIPYSNVFMRTIITMGEFPYSVGFWTENSVPLSEVSHLVRFSLLLNHKRKFWTSQKCPT